MSVGTFGPFGAAQQQLAREQVGILPCEAWGSSKSPSGTGHVLRLLTSTEILASKFHDRQGCVSTPVAYLSSRDVLSHRGIITDGCSTSSTGLGMRDCMTSPASCIMQRSPRFTSVTALTRCYLAPRGRMLHAAHACVVLLTVHPCTWPSKPTTWQS